MTGKMLKKLINKTLANFPMQQNISSAEIGKLWMQYFSDKPDDLMETALNMILADAKYWPTVSDIKNAIKELTTVNYNSVTFKQLDNPYGKRMTPAAKKAFDSVKSGKARQYLANMDIEDIKQYVKNLFPDMSDDFIRQNYNELSFAAESAERCSVCMWDAAGCETNGYYPSPFLENDSYIKLEYTPCTKRKRGC